MAVPQLANILHPHPRDCQYRLRRRSNSWRFGLSSRSYGSCADRLGDAQRHPWKAEAATRIIDYVHPDRYSRPAAEASVGHRTETPRHRGQGC